MDVDIFFGVLILVSVMLSITVLIIAILGLASPTLKQRFAGLLSGLAIVLPLPTGVIIGFIAGFMIAFSSCYKQACSPIEEYALLWIPALSLAVSVPLLIFGIARFKKLKAVVATHSAPWIIALILALLVALTNITGLLNYLPWLF